MGLAGIDWPDDEPRMRAALVDAGWTCGLTLENDAFSPIRACAPHGYGIGVAAGTGIAAGIIRPDGETYSYCAFVDMGGGRDIDEQVLHAVIRAEDGRGPATVLTQGLLEVTGRTSVPELVYDVHRGGYHPPHGRVRPMLFAAANEGDGAAVAIVKRFGAELALCATNLIRRYDIASEEPAVVAAGTLFVRTGTLLFESFRREVLAAAPRAQVLLEDRPPVMGALRGALQARGWDSPNVWQRLNETAVREGWFEGDGSDQAEGVESDE
jgi:N-acetylglucosamine kinase-like BadF-type ATPase